MSKYRDVTGRGVSQQWRQNVVTFLRLLQSWFLSRRLVHHIGVFVLNGHYGRSLWEGQRYVVLPQVNSVEAKFLPLLLDVQCLLIAES